MKINTARRNTETDLIDSLISFNTIFIKTQSKKNYFFFYLNCNTKKNQNFSLFWNGRILLLLCFDVEGERKKTIDIVFQAF